VRANSFQHGQIPELVLNPDPSIRWHTRQNNDGEGLGPGEFPVFLEFDFGGAVRITQLALTSRDGVTTGDVPPGAVLQAGLLTPIAAAQGFPCQEDVTLLLRYLAGNVAALPPLKDLI